MNEELQQLLDEEAQLRFSSFSHETAWQLGSLLRDKAITMNASLAIEIKINGCVLFYIALAGTTIDNHDWIRRKSNITQHYGHSSWLMKRKYELREQNFNTATQLPLADYAPYGGSYPLYVEDLLLGTVTVSGLAQIEDHHFVISGIREMIDRVNNR